MAVISLTSVLDYYTALALATFKSACLVLFAVRCLFSTYIAFFRVLFKHRNYESKNFHGCHEFVLAIMITLSLMVLMGYMFIFSLFAFWYKTSIEESMSCNSILDSVTCKLLIGKLYYNPHASVSHTNWLVVSQVCIAPNVLFLLIFIMFYLLRRPHDCFECLSVDKNIRISIFQFT